MSVRGNVDAVLYCTQGNMPLWLHSRLKTGVICSNATPGWSQGPAGCQGRRMTRETVGWKQTRKPWSAYLLDHLSSVTQLCCPTLCDPMNRSMRSLSTTNSWSLLKLMSVKSVMPSNHFIFCRSLLLLPSIFPSICIFSNESVLIRWPKYWSFSFSISSFNEYSGLISFRMDWLDLLAVQGTLKSLLQHHSSKASILQHSAFLMV